MGLVNWNTVNIRSFSALNDADNFKCIKSFKMQNIRIIYVTAVHFQGEGDFSASEWHEKIVLDNRKKSYWSEMFEREIQRDARGEN